MFALFRSFSAIMFGAFGIGRAMGTVPDFSKAKVATAELFRLMDREPEIDTFSDEGEKPVSSRLIKNHMNVALSCR